MTRRILSILAAAMVLSLPLAAEAQWSVSPHIVVSVPEQKFANVGKTGGGFGIKFEHYSNVSRRGFGLRGDFAFLSFGRKTSVIVDQFGFPVPIESRNEGFRLTGGPMYSVGGRSLKAYVAATGGVYFFRTNITATLSSFNGTQFFQDSQGNNWSLGWNVGGGLQYDIGLGPWLDVSFEYQTMYNLPAAKEDADVTASVPDITAHEFTIKFGVIFFLGR